MTNPNRIYLEQPAATGDEALPIGNGRLGAMVFGSVESERLQLNEDTLWSGEPVAASGPERAAPLAAVRQLILDR